MMRALRTSCVLVHSLYAMPRYGGCPRLSRIHTRAAVAGVVSDFVSTPVMMRLKASESSSEASSAPAFSNMSAISCLLALMPSNCASRGFRLTIWRCQIIGHPATQCTVTRRQLQSRLQGIAQFRCIDSAATICIDQPEALIKLLLLCVTDLWGWRATMDSEPSV